MKPWQWVVVILTAGVMSGVIYTRVKPQWPQPAKQAAPDSGIAGYAVDGHQHLCQPHQHHSGYTWTPHRYPRTVGGEITATIHHGYSPMRVAANTPDAQWIVNPPTEIAW